jgi:hypothetical protein
LTILQAGVLLADSFILWIRHASSGMISFHITVGVCFHINSRRKPDPLAKILYGKCHNLVSRVNYLINLVLLMSATREQPE